MLLVKEKTEIEIDKNLRNLTNYFAWKTLFSFILPSVGLAQQQAESYNEMRRVRGRGLCLF